MLILKIKKFIAKESLARLRKRVRSNLNQSANAMIYSYIFYQGHSGYMRDKDCYYG